MACVIIGAVLQGVGLLLVFVELAVIRSHEFGVAPPWVRFGRWARHLLGRSRVVEGKASLSGFGTLTGRGRTPKPSKLEEGASVAERIARLERYVEHLDRDVDSMYRAIDIRAEEVTAAAKGREQAIRDEIAVRDTERRQRLRGSLTRQAVGGVCVLLGLVVGTVGSLV